MDHLHSSPGSLKGGGNDPHNHRYYPIVLKMVLWDEPRAAIDQKLKVNQIPREIAERLIRLAVTDRVRTIRKDAFKKILLGFLFLGLTGAVFAFFWFSLGYIQRTILVCCSLIAAYGLCKTINGTLSFFMAGSFRGSVADEL